MTGSQLYRAYKLKLKLAMQDPDIPSPRYHTIIFVKTLAEGPGSGVKRHVVGDVVSGMCYESKAYHDSESPESIHSKELVGYTEASTYAQTWDSVLSAIPSPPKQKAFNTKTMKTEPVKSWEPLTLYNTGEPRKPLVKCTEWTENQAIPTLIRQGLIQPTA